MAEAACLACKQPLTSCLCVSRARAAVPCCHVCGQPGHTHLACPLVRSLAPGFYWCEFQHLGVMYAGLMRPAPQGTEAHRRMREAEAQLQALPRDFVFWSPRFVYRDEQCTGPTPSCSGQPSRAARTK